jgi:hypothetical protein
MQLPTSFSSASFTPQASQRPPQPQRNSSTEQANERPVQRQDAAQQAAEDNISSRQSPPEQIEQTERVEQARTSELPSQDLQTRPREQAGSANPAVNQYQQIAREEASNAQAQDPSLFRVDVYV